VALEAAVEPTEATEAAEAVPFWFAVDTALEEVELPPVLLTRVFILRNRRGRGASLCVEDAGDCGLECVEESSLSSRPLWPEFKLVLLLFLLATLEAAVAAERLPERGGPVSKTSPIDTIKAVLVGMFPRISYITD
jgi:hypothetical protein